MSAPAYGQPFERSERNTDPQNLTNQTDTNLASVSAPIFNPEQEDKEDVKDQDSQQDSAENTDANDESSPAVAPVQIETETEEETEVEGKQEEKEIDTPLEDESSENQEADEDNSDQADEDQAGKEEEEKEEKDGVEEEIATKTNEIAEKSGKAEEQKDAQETAINEKSNDDSSKVELQPSASPLQASEGKGIVSNPKSSVDTQVDQFLYAVSEDELQNFDPTAILSKNANGSYTVSSPEKLTGIEKSQSIVEIDPSVIANLMADRKAQNDASLAVFLAGNEGKIGDIQNQSTSNTSKISSSLASAMGQIMAAEQMALSNVESAYSAAIAAAEASAASALATVSGQLATTLGAINSDHSSGLSNLASALATSLETAATLQTTIVDASNVKFDEAAVKMIEEGTRVGDLAMVEARTRADIEDAKPIKDMSRSARFFEGGDYEKNKHDARVNACISVGEGMQKSFNETAAQASQSLLESKGSTGSELGAKFADLTTSLQTEHDTKVKELDAAKTSAINSAQMIHSSSVASITAQKAAQLQMLATTHSGKLAEISSTAGQQRNQLQTTGANLKAQLESTIAEGIQKLRAINDRVALEAQELEKVEPDQFQDFLNDGAQNFSAESQNFISIVASTTSSACDSLTQAGAQTQQALTEMATGATTAFTEATSSFTQTITTLTSSISQQFSGLATSFTGQISSTVTAASSTFDAVLTDAETQFQTAVDGVEGALNSAISEVVAGFDGELTKIGSLMTTKADEAEAAVQPRWKSIVKIIIEVVIAIAVIVAVTALMVSGVGPLMLIVGAVLIGAAGGVIKQVANNALDGKPLTEGVGTAAAFGALDGLTALVGGGIGTAIATKLASKVVSTGAQVAIKYVASTVVEATVDSIGSGIKNVVTNIQQGNGFSLGAFVDGFKNDFVKNLAINAAANGLMEFTPVKGWLDRIATNGANGANPTSTPTSNIDLTLPKVDVPASTIDIKPEIEITTPKVEPTIKAEVDANPKVEVDGTPKADVETTTPKAETEVTPKPETEVTPKPETEVTPKPETEVTPKPEAETGPKTDVETGPKPEAEVAPKAETDAPEIHQSPSAIKAADAGLPKAPDGYFYNQSKDGTLYIQRNAKVDADGNPVPQLKIEGTNLIDENGFVHNVSDDLVNAFKPGNSQSSVLEAPKGSRAMPEEYLDPDFISNHLAKFESEGTVSRIVLKDDYIEYGVGKPDPGNTEFVSLKSDTDQLIKDANGDLDLLSAALGVPRSQLEGGLVRIDFTVTKDNPVHFPTGNEFGANSQWIPGGSLPTGQIEAVVKTQDMVLGTDYTVTDL